MAERKRNTMAKQTIEFYGGTSDYIWLSFRGAYWAINKEGEVFPAYETIEQHIAKGSMPPLSIGGAWFWLASRGIINNLREVG